MKSSLRKNVPRCVCVSFAGLLLATGSQASIRLAPDLVAGATLADILDANGPYNGIFQVFDKQFSITGFSGANAAEIMFNPVIFTNPLDGVGFDMVFILGSGDVFDDDNESGFASSSTEKSILLNYTVTITDPLFVIKDALLASSGSAMSNGSDFDGDDGSAFISVTETYSGTGLSNSLMIVDDFLGGIVTDQQFFSGNPQTTIDVAKMILISAQGGEEVDFDSDDSAEASLNFIRQTFSQQLVPTPGTGLVLLAPMLGVLRRRRS